MAQLWPVTSQLKVDQMLSKETSIIDTNGLSDRLKAIEADIKIMYNKKLTKPALQDRVLSLITERKTCFGIVRKWKPGDQARQGPHGCKLQNVGSQHPVTHL